MRQATLSSSVFVALLALAAPAAAATYNFVNIADTRGPLEGVDFFAQAVSDTRTVAFIGYQGGVVATYIGDGTTTSVVAPDLSPPAGFRTVGPIFAVNDSGAAVAIVNRNSDEAGNQVPQQNQLQLYDPSGARTIAELLSSTEVIRGFSLPVINNSGAVAFASVTDDHTQSIRQTNIMRWSDGTATTIFETTRRDNYVFDIAMNERGDVAFRANYPFPNDSLSIYRTDGATLTPIADSDGPLQISPNVSRGTAINDSGTVAFWTSLDSGGEGIFVGDGGPLTTVAIADPTTPFFEFAEDVQINNQGTVAFTARLWNGSFGIYAGSDPVNDKVVEVGDFLFGQRVSGLGRPHLNNRGDIAFWYEVRDPRDPRDYLTGIALALRDLPLAGDTNGDGLINIDDLNAVRNNFGTDGQPDGTLPGDAYPFDGMVNIDDLNAVRNNFGAGAAVPEPTGLALLAIALVGVGLRLPLLRAIGARRVCLFAVFGLVPAGLCGTVQATSFTFSKVADTSTPIPGGQGNFTEFSSDHPYGYAFDAGKVAFVGRGASGQAGVYVGVPGQVTLVADKNTPMPSGPGNFSEFVGLSFDDGQVAFVAHYLMDGQLRYEGVYTDLGGTLAAVADSNTPIPNSIGTFGVKFQHGLSLRAGQVVFAASNIFDEPGIYRSGLDGLVAIVDASTVVPGGTGNFMGARGAAQSPDGGEVAFLGFSFDGVRDQLGIYLASETGVTRVANRSTRIPGGSGNFTGLDTPSLGDGEVVFRGRGTSGQEGVFRGDGLSLTRLVGTGDPVPRGQGTFQQLLNPSLDAGSVAFFGENFGILPYERGIYTNLGGSWEKVIDVTDSLDGRAIDFLEFSPEGLSGNQLALKVWFVDGFQGLYIATADLPLPGDTNGDRLVDIDDLNNVRNNFGAAGPDDGSLAGDAYPFDGLVNIDDLNAVRNHFGAAAAAVPEPGGFALALVGLLFWRLPARGGAGRRRVN